MGEAAKAGGRGPTIEHEGVNYELSPWDLDMCQMLELWLEDRAWNAVERLRHRLTEEQYERRLDVVTRQVAACRYSYGSRAYMEASRSLEGQKYMAFLMLSKKNRGMSVSLAGEIYEANILQLQAKMKAMDADPNSASPGGGEKTTSPATSATATTPITSP